MKFRIVPITVAAAQGPGAWSSGQRAQPAWSSVGHSDGAPTQWCPKPGHWGARDQGQIGGHRGLTSSYSVGLCKQV